MQRCDNQKETATGAPGFYGAGRRHPVLSAQLATSRPPHFYRFYSSGRKLFLQARGRCFSSRALPTGATICRLRGHPSKNTFKQPPPKACQLRTLQGVQIFQTHTRRRPKLFLLAHTSGMLTAAATRLWISLFSSGKNL